MGKNGSHLFKCMHAQIHNNLQSMHTHECLEMCHDLINQKPSCLCKCFGWAQTKRVLKSTSINLIRMNATMIQRSETNAEKSKHSHIDIECLVHQHSTSAERWWLKITRCSFWMHPEWVKAAKELTNWKNTNWHCTFSANSAVIQAENANRRYCNLVLCYFERIEMPTSIWICGTEPNRTE